MAGLNLAAFDIAVGASSECWPAVKPSRAAGTIHDSSAFAPKRDRSECQLSKKMS